MSWRDKAACGGEDPRLFDPVELHSNAEWAFLEQAAQTWCSNCPVLAACGADADLNRHSGTWGGTYRRVQHGKYVWRVLADGGWEPQLTDRRSGVRIGRGAA